MSSGKNSREINTPFRNVERADSRQLLKRAWWIIALNLFVPGSVQIVAGNKKFGRLGIIFTLSFWLFLVAAGFFALVSKVALFTLVTSPMFATPIGIGFVIYAILIALSTLDALRLMYLHRINSRFKALVLVLVLLTGTFNGYVAGTIGSTALTASNFTSTVFKHSGSLEQTKGRYNILLLGGDSGSNRLGLRPDSISIISVSAETGVAVNIGLPRNLTNIQFKEGTPIRSVYPYGFNNNCGGQCFLNAIYKVTMDNHRDLYPGMAKKSTTAGVEATKSAVEWITGLEIHAYVLINMKSFVDLVDALGGITVNVKKALPIGGQQDCVPADNERGSYCPDAMGWIEKGKQHMDGRTALWYARSRHNTDDYDRMKRQREVEKIVLKKIDLQTLLFRLGSVAGAGAKLIKTDIPGSALPTMMDLALKAKSAGLKNLQLSYPTIQADNPDFWLMRKLIAQKIKKYK
ncbi:MAG: LCP family protein [Rhodoluna sp.]|jgi:LCP family protein required for cell wall assembly